MMDPNLISQTSLDIYTLSSQVQNLCDHLFFMMGKSIRSNTTLASSTIEPNHAGRKQD